VFWVEFIVRIESYGFNPKHSSGIFNYIDVTNDEEFEENLSDLSKELK